MKARFSLAVGLLLSAMSCSFASDNFSNNFAGITQTSLDVLTKDLGAAIGGGSFHTGQALGFPLGFDVGVHVAAVGVKGDDTILRDDSSTLLSKWVQAEVGLPARINLIGRIGKIEDANAYGGGLRLGLLTSSTPGIPSISITGLYTQAKHDMFDAKTISANAVVSFDVPFVHPYIGVGYDRTTVDVSDDSSIPAASRSLTSTKNGSRVEAGINLSFIPFTYLTLGGGLANGERLYHGALGVKF